MPECLSITGQRGRQKIATCKYLPYCRKAEPLGSRLPCEDILPFEAAGDPSPPNKPRGKGKQIVIERIFDVWPAGQPAVTITQLAEAMEQHETTARCYLERAVDKGLVIKNGKLGRANLYQRV